MNPIGQRLLKAVALIVVDVVRRGLRRVLRRVIP